MKSVNQPIAKIIAAVSREKHVVYQPITVQADIIAMKTGTIVFRASPMASFAPKTNFANPAIVKMEFVAHGGRNAVRSIAIAAAKNIATTA